jgi:hypothetical protein
MRRDFMVDKLEVLVVVAVGLGPEETWHRHVEAGLNALE